MSNLKDTDFDDLFRRASDKYPLRTDSSDWDRMAAALEKDPSPDTPDDSDNTDKRRRRRLIFWWFLLLPLAAIGYYVAKSSGHGSGSGRTNDNNNIAITKPAGTNKTGDNATVKNNTGSTNSPATNTPANPSRNTSGATAPKTSTATNPGGNAAGNPGGAATTTRNTTPAATPNTTLASTAGQAGGGMPLAAPRMGRQNKSQSQTKIIRSAEGDIPSRPQSATTGSGTSRPKTDETTTASTGNNNGALGTPGLNSTNTAKTPAGPLSLRYSDINQQRTGTAGAYNLNVTVKAPVITAATNKKDSTNKSQKTKTHYLYAGLIVAPDLSTVKLQKATGIGTTLGALIGYAFNDHWAIETGAYVDRKRYYTDGEYFNTKNVRFPPNYKLLNVDGTCYMWEIPLNVRYTFNPAAKTRWFATAGLSTYLMNRENYTYAYEYNGWSGSSAWNLKKASQYPFSVVGISAGLEQPLGKLGNLRIEPYARLPLGGIGTGKLPIMSTGINIGITRRLWQKK